MISGLIEAKKGTQINNTIFNILRVTFSALSNTVIYKVQLKFFLLKIIPFFYSSHFPINSNYFKQIYVCKWYKQKIWPLLL